MPDERGRQELRQLLDGFSDWEVLLDQSERIHRFSPMLFRHLRPHCEGLVPETVLEQLAKSYRDNVTRTFQLTAALIRLAESLDDAGVRWISYKGPVLAQALYGDLGLRHSIDVDLLVARDSFDRVREILGFHGLEEGPGGGESEDVLSSLHYFQAETGVQVDVHWRLFRPYYGMGFDFDALWERRQKVEVGGRPMNALHPHDRIIILGAHGTKHLWQLFKWLCDFRLAVDACRDEEWGPVMQRCRSLQAGPLFFPALWALHHLLGVRLPGPVGERLGEFPEAERTGRQLALSALSGSPTGSFSSSWLKLKLMPTTRLRLHYVADGVRRRIAGLSPPARGRISGSEGCLGTGRRRGPKEKGGR